MMNKTFTKKCLAEYVKLIWYFELTLVAKYNLNDNPYLCQHFFPRRGFLKHENAEFEYRFHGSGCSFNYLGFEVHYDYLITKPDYIKTVPWKFWRYTVSQSKKEHILELTEDEVAEMLEDLSKTEILHKVDPDYVQYQIAFSWVNSYS